MDTTGEARIALDDAERAVVGTDPVEGERARRAQLCRPITHRRGGFLIPERNESAAGPASRPHRASVKCQGPHPAPEAEGPRGELDSLDEFLGHPAARVRGRIAEAHSGGKPGETRFPDETAALGRFFRDPRIRCEGAGESCEGQLVVQREECRERIAEYSDRRGELFVGRGEVEDLLAGGPEQVDAFRFDDCQDARAKPFRIVHRSRHAVVPGEGPRPPAERMPRRIGPDHAQPLAMEATGQVERGGSAGAGEQDRFHRAPGLSHPRSAPSSAVRAALRLLR